MKPVDFIASLKESAIVFWEARNGRERSILAVGGAFALLALIYAICFAPALSGRARLAKDLPSLRQHSLELQSLARRAAELNGAAPPPVTSISQESIASSLVALGMKPQSLVVTDDLVRVQLNPVSFAGMVNWINQQRLASRLEVVDANFIALPQNDMVNASLTLRQQRGGE